MLFFLSFKANARVKPAKMWHGPHSSKFLYCSMYLFVCRLCYSMYCLFWLVLCIASLCKCVLYYCHRVATQLQLTNISTNKKYKGNGEKKQLKERIRIQNLRGRMFGLKK